MGAVTARLFSQEGAKLVIAARRIDKLQAIAREVGAIAVEADIRKEEDLARLAETATRAFGRLHAAINFAGVNSAAPIREVTREALLDACEVYFIGTALFFKHMVNAMTDGGSLVTISSLIALVAPPGLTAYAGSKKGADQIVRIAAGELGPSGIRVNSIAPGFTRSEMTEGYFAIPTLEGAFVREIPLGRLGSVEDVARGAVARIEHLGVDHWSGATRPVDNRCVGPRGRTRSWRDPRIPSGIVSCLDQQGQLNR